MHRNREEREREYKDDSLRAIQNAAIAVVLAIVTVTTVTLIVLI